MECNAADVENMDQDATDANDLDHWKLFCAESVCEMTIPLIMSKNKEQILQEIDNLVISNNWIIDFIMPLSSSITTTNYSTYLPNETIAYDKKENFNMDQFSYNFVHLLYLHCI